MKIDRTQEIRENVAVEAKRLRGRIPVCAYTLDAAVSDQGDQSCDADHTETCRGLAHGDGLAIAELATAAPILAAELNRLRVLLRQHGIDSEELET